MSNFRPLTDYEKSILNRMLEYVFECKESIQDQVNNLSARSYNDPDNYGSIELATTSSLVAECKTNVPIELEAFDTDEVSVAALLHVTDGVVSELEFYKADGSSIKSRPEAEAYQRKAGG